MASQPKGFYVSIGLNKPNRFEPQNLSPLIFAEKCALEMARFFYEKNFRGQINKPKNQPFESAQNQPLLGASATKLNVLKKFKSLYKKVKSTDFLVIFFCGHGRKMNVQHSTEPPNELEKQDETWVLFDQDLPDDEIFQIISNFLHRPRILVISDSCYSGGLLDIKTTKKNMNADWNLIFLAASGENEQTWEFLESSEIKSTYFMEAMNQTLKKKPANYPNFFEQLKTELTQFTNQIKPELIQIGDKNRLHQFSNQPPFTL